MANAKNSKLKEDAITWYTEKRETYQQLSKKVESIIQELIKDGGILIHGIHSRAKEISSFSKKIEDEKYIDPISQITDCAGVRVIAYVESDLDKISKIITDNFDIDPKNSINKTQALGVDKVGYRSIHFIAKLPSDRLKLAEYKKYKGMFFEIQIRTILQHAWAEIEHDKDYKFSGELPPLLKRRFKVLAGVLELADREFNEIANSIDNYSAAVNTDTQKGKLDILIDSTSLKSYLEITFSVAIKEGTLDTSSDVSRELISEIRAMGIETLKEFDKIIPKDFSNKVITQSRKRTYAGLVRNVLMIHDIDKYFTTAWNKHWIGISPGTIDVLKSYKIDIDKQIGLNNLYIL